MDLDTTPAHAEQTMPIDAATTAICQLWGDDASIEQFTKPWPDAWGISTHQLLQLDSTKNTTNAWKM